MSSLAELERRLELSIQQQLEGYLAQKREMIIGEAITSFTRAVREAVGKAAVEVSDMYSVQRAGSDLVIRVKLEMDKT
jgi:hypothetical protein